MSAIKKLFGGDKKKATPVPKKETKSEALVNAEQREKERPAVMGRGELLLGNQSILSSSGNDSTSRNKILGN